MAIILDFAEKIKISDIRVSEAEDKAWEELDSKEERENWEDEKEEDILIKRSLEDEEVNMDVDKQVSICKVDLDKRLIYGVVYEPDVEDSQGDGASAEEIEKAAHLFLKEYRNISYMHKDLINEDAPIVECYILPVEMIMGGQTVKKGSWILVTKIEDDSLWGEVKEGKITGYSLEGTATS